MSEELILILVIAIIIYLLISRYFRKAREADESTLRPMLEWSILANRGSYIEREKRCYSLITQASSGLERLGIIPEKTLRNLMIQTPEASKANLVILIMNLAEDFAKERGYDKDLERNSYYTLQARVYFSTCIQIIIEEKGLEILKILTVAACNKPIEWKHIQA